MSEMMNTDERLIYMANQIAAFFAAQGETRAVAGIADHIEKFWTPRMRHDLIALAKKDSSRFQAHVHAAIKQVAAAQAAG